jgi:hypothetical protein
VVVDSTATGRSLESILALYHERVKTRGPLIGRMKETRDAYNGDIVIPLPEMDRSERSSVANLIASGLDQTAMRISSTTPSIYFPPVEYGNRASEKRARTRTLATEGWWQVNRMDLKIRQRSRWLIGYASTPVVLKPDSKWGCARWYIRDPLSTYPSDPIDASDLTPENTIFTYERNRAWLMSRYPLALLTLAGRTDEKPDDKFTILEYQDEQVTVLAVLTSASNTTFAIRSGKEFAELERIPNRTGMSLAVVPGRINLDKPMGQFEGLIGMYQMQAKLMALNVIATERAIFPDTYLVSRPGETARFVSGPFDGRTGQVNIIGGGDVKEVAVNPGFNTAAVEDRIERNMRVTGGIAAEMGGESQTNVRTGKRGDAIMSAVLDFPIQEAQEILSASLEEENKRAVAISKSYFGNERKSFFISGRGVNAHVDYVPSKDFENDNNTVTYPHAGSDANSLVVGLGQRIGTGTISKRSAMEIDPMIADPELEHDRIISEALEMALLQSIQQQASQGAIIPSDLALISDMVGSDKESLADAVTKVHELAQKRQATAAPAASAPTQMGLGAPGQGAEQPSIAPPTPSSSNLAQMLSALKSPNSGAPVA